MKIALFGATGQVATEVQRRAPADVTLDVIGRDRLDFSQPEDVLDYGLTIDADAVINAVAYTAVDKAEDEPELALAINGRSVGALGTSCAEKNIPVLHISTDYVFPGDGQTPWQPGDATEPLGAYGQSKLDGETRLRESGARHTILRTSWVFSAHGANFVKTMLRLCRERDSLTVVDDQIGGPTPAADIADACLKISAALANGHYGGTYHFSGAPDVSWADFAREIFTQSEQKVRIGDIPSSDFPTKARRPMNSRLDCSTLKSDFQISRPDWRVGLKNVLDELRN